MGEKGILNKKRSNYKLDPCLGKVGGRIQKSIVSEEMKHPVLLARKSEIAVMIIRWCHEKVAHSGRGITMNYIRSSGFWIINRNAAVRSYITKCVTCRHLRGNFSSKKWHRSQEMGCGGTFYILQCRPIWAICNQRRLQGAKTLWSFIHMLIQQSHPH